MQNAKTMTEVTAVFVRQATRQSPMIFHALRSNANLAMFGVMAALTKTSASYNIRVLKGANVVIMSDHTPVRA